MADTITNMEENITITQLYDGKVEAKFMGPTVDKPSRHIYYMNGERKKSVTGIIGIKDKSIPLVSWALEEAAKSLIGVLESGKKIKEDEIVKAVYASEESKNKAADIGTEVHDWIERYIRFKLKQKGYEKLPTMPDDQNVMTGVTSFLNWEAEHKVKYLWAEKLLFSKKYDFMGKGDFGAVVDGKRCLCDNKTGNGLYNSVRLQTAAYRYADEEESGLKYTGRWALRISKETKDEYEERMALKNRIKAILGKKPVEVKPYAVFEAKYLDDDKNAYKADFDGFRACLELNQWESANYSV